ncbi:MAG TPA: AMP-binding protein [bacterium]|nr:AMP-binding protein [bacterium]
MNLAERIRLSAEKHDGRTAVVFYDRRIRYGELWADVEKLAAGLRDEGLAPGGRIALVMPNVPEYVAAFFASLCCGAEVVSINPQYTAREIGFILKDASVGFVVVHPMFDMPVRTVAEKYPLKIFYSDSMGDPAKKDLKSLINQSAAVLKPVEKRPDDTALIVYTNASGGYPMGACLTHDGLFFDADACRRVAVVDEMDTLLSVIPLYHAFSKTVCMNMPLLGGGKMVLHETFNEDRVAIDIEKERVSMFPAVPAIFKRLLDVHGNAGKNYSFVKAFIPGGAPTPVPVLEGFAEAFNAAVYQGYGITECGPVTSVNPIYRKENKLGSVGPPLSGIQVRVSEEGELCVKGRNVMKGYLGHDKETQEFLIDGWFHTGDRARIDGDGFIYITGHLKRLILVGGFNVYPGEVEMVLGAHPEVKSCKVFGEQNDLLGERVVAEVVLRDGAAIDAAELRKYLRKRIASYKTPRKIEIAMEN